MIMSTPPPPLAPGVDVSCTKKGHSFRGDQSNRQHVSLRLMDMVELAEANEAGQPHWAAAEVTRPSVSILCLGVSTTSVQRLPPKSGCGIKPADSDDLVVGNRVSTT